jgi:MSP (Major sperm protein) domain
LLLRTTTDNKQVKTTQPRRYLVRPNQGLIAPGGSEVVQILLVEKDKTQLLQSYSTIGESALEQCRDKFLVQSIAVDFGVSEKLANYEELTSFWTTMTSGKNPGIANVKLQVKHQVDGASAGTSPPPSRHHQLPIENMTGSEMAAELSSLRTKYDELVSFSVNLTAERDLLNNALEQSKRDLQLATYNNNGGKSPTASSMKKKGSGAAMAKSSSSSSLTILMVALVTVMIGIVAGAKLHQMGLLRQVPILRDHLYHGDEL